MEERFFHKEIVILGQGCNSNCVFCFQEKREPAFFPTRELFEKIVKARNRGANWLILSGGEPTIHPDFLGLVRAARDVGYRRIQVTTNGRMFASGEFTRGAAEAGLTEATLSVHGSTAEKHDALTCVPGSFEQVSRAAENCRKEGIKLSFNTAVNSLNIDDLKDIIQYIHEGLGFEQFDYDLVGTVPGGRSWERDLMPDHGDIRENYRKTLKYAEEHGLVVWVLRTPIENFPRGYEYHKEPWESMAHDVISQWTRVWSAGFSCGEGKCEYCEGRPICNYVKPLYNKAKCGELDYITGSPDPQKLEDARGLSRNFMVKNFKDVSAVEDAGFRPFFRASFDGLSGGLDGVVHKLELAESAGIPAELVFSVNHESLGSLDQLDGGLDTWFSPTNPYKYVKYGFEGSNIMFDTTGVLMSLPEVFESVKGKWMNVPLCMKKGREREYWLNLDDFSGDMELRPRRFANRLSAEVRVHRWECDECTLARECPGFFGDYVKLFGFEDVKSAD